MTYYEMHDGNETGEALPVRTLKGTGEIIAEYSFEEPTCLSVIYCVGTQALDEVIGYLCIPSCPFEITLR